MHTYAVAVEFGNETVAVIPVIAESAEAAQLSARQRSSFWTEFRPEEQLDEDGEPFDAKSNGWLSVVSHHLNREMGMLLLKDKLSPEDQEKVLAFAKTLPSYKGEKDTPWQAEPNHA